MIAAIDDNLALILVAVITFFGLFVTPLMGLYTQMYLRRHLGKTNGSGPVADIVERVERKVDVETTAAYGHRVEDRVLFGILFDRVGLPMPELPEIRKPLVGKGVEDHHGTSQLDQPH